MPSAAKVSFGAHFVPKLIIALREGYSASRLSSDLMAGLTVAILALPLSMAIAIGAGATPDRGLITSVVAGFFISATGGSRYQIGGPAAAFIVIVANIIAVQGMAGLMTATFLAGFILVAAALLRIGSYIKYIPGPVILGFTSGIGILIAVGQLKDFLGLRGDVPAEFLHKLAALWHIKSTFTVSALLIGLVTLAVIYGMRVLCPRWPGMLFAVVIASGLAWAFGLPVDTIGSRFGGIPASLPTPVLPDLSMTMVTSVLPSAFTIAFLVGVESLLSAVAADAISGGRHRSNAEVLGQGIANIASPLFGGLPATGVIARTGTNIAAGAKTPLSGIFHAGFVLAFMLLMAPLASYLALPCLAAVLLSVAWRLIDYREVSHFLVRAPFDDRLVLLATLILTVVADLNVAIGVGFGLACMLFMHRMSEAVVADAGHPSSLDGDLDDVEKPRSALTQIELPAGIQVLSLRGPLFFGGASALSDALKAGGTYPKVLILRMRDVPLIDATALSALEDMATELTDRGGRLIISGVQKQPHEALQRMELLERHQVILASNGFVALEKAKRLVGGEAAA